MAPRRQVYACLAVLAAGALLFGCGGSGEPSGEPLSDQEVTDYTDNLDKIQAAVDDGDCDTAQTKLTTLTSAVEASNEDGDQTKTDLVTLLDDLGAQIDSDCEPVQETTSTTSTTETTETVPTETSTTEPTTTSTTEEESSTTTEETTTEPPEEEPPGGGSTPPGGGGDDSGGFEAGKEKAGKGPKPGKGPKDDKGPKPGHGSGPTGGSSPGKEAKG
jgi:hypothetical protein